MFVAFFFMAWNGGCTRTYKGWIVSRFRGTAEFEFIPEIMLGESDDDDDFITYSTRVYSVFQVEFLFFFALLVNIGSRTKARGCKGEGAN